MRQKVLYRSVRRLLREDEQIEHLVYLWSRHRWMVPYCVAAGVALFLVAWFSGIEQLGGRLAIGLGGIAVAALASSDYRVLVQSSSARGPRQLTMLRASRFRQVAKGVIGQLAPDVKIAIVGTTLVMTEWMIDGRQYSVMRRFQSAMTAIASP